MQISHTLTLFIIQYQKIIVSNSITNLIRKSFNIVKLSYSCWPIYASQNLIFIWNLGIHYWQHTFNYCPWEHFVFFIKMPTKYPTLNNHRLSLIFFQVKIEFHEKRSNFRLHINYAGDFFFKQPHRILKGCVLWVLRHN